MGEGKKGIESGDNRKKKKKAQNQAAIKVTGREGFGVQSLMCLKIWCKKQKER